MLIRKPDDIPARDITPRETYFSRRNLLRGAALAASVTATGIVYRLLSTPRAAPDRPQAKIAFTNSTSEPDRRAMGFLTDEPRTPLSSITHYNNFYEFSTAKDEVAALAANFISRPWTVAIDGLCAKPRTFDLDDIARLAPIEERVYRHRCVEAWSMVIPWLGFPLATLLKQVEPLSDAKFVAFQTLMDAKRFPNQNYEVLPWPYVEGLRMDEALHPLTILATGLYGAELPPQDGAPLRLVCPWKYGFKGIKSIVRISLVKEQPPTTWNIVAPREYGFNSNVNPEVDHPRWSQATERRLLEPPKFKVIATLPFNGYAEQVAHLYAGMDLVKDF